VSDYWILIDILMIGSIKKSRTKISPALKYFIS